MPYGQKFKDKLIKKGVKKTPIKKKPVKRKKRK